MSYLQTVSIVRTAANAVNSNRFDHGRIVDFSQNFNKPFPYIWLYPFDIRDADPTSDDQFDTTTVRVGFWFQDKPDSSIQEREVLIGKADELCNAFLEELRENMRIIIENVRREPQYQFHNATVSGMALEFDIRTLTPC